MTPRSATVVLFYPFFSSVGVTTTKRNSNGPTTVIPHKSKRERPTTKTWATEGRRTTQPKHLSANNNHKGRRKKITPAPKTKARARPRRRPHNEANIENRFLAETTRGIESSHKNVSRGRLHTHMHAHYAVTRGHPYVQLEHYLPKP